MTHQFHNTVQKVCRIFRSKYRLSSAEAEDMYSTIVLHLTKVSQDEDEALLLNEDRYLRTIVNNSARDFLRKIVRQRQKQVSLQDYHHLPADDISLVPQHQLWLEQALGKLSPDQLKVIRIFYGLEDESPVRDLQTIAKRTGFSRGQVERLHDSAMAILQRLAN